MPGAQATARQRRRDRNGRCKPGVFTHRTVATARNRASGFGGDWRVRQQLPVGVGPDDRMPPGSREPKVRPADGSRRCARQTGQHCSSQNQSSRKKKNSSRNNNISNRQMTGMKKQKPPSERPRNERGGASARPLSAPPARGLFPARADGHLSSCLPGVFRHADE